MQKSEIEKSNFHKLPDKLLNDIQCRPMVLFVGSGIVSDIVPSWRDLLKQLLVQSARKILLDKKLTAGDTEELLSLLQDERNFSLYEQAGIIKIMLDKEYISHIRREIYKKYSIDKLKKNDFIRNIARLCRFRCVHAVVTYNYDDLLERAINNDIGELRVPYSVCGDKQTIIRNNNILPIYHVHGFIPNKRRIPSTSESRVVLSFDEYFQNMLEPFSWQTTTQLHFLQNYTCLYLGASLKDWNMQRMLAFAKKNVNISAIYLLKRSIEDFPDGNKIGNPKVKTMLNKINSTILKELGVNVIIPGNDYQSVSNSVVELDSRLQELGFPIFSKIPSNS